MFGVVERNIWLHSKPISEASKYDLLTNELCGVFKMAITTMSCSIQSYFLDQCR